MGFKDKLKVLEKSMQGQLAYIELEDGTRSWFDPEQARIETFMHATRSPQNGRRVQ